jgi:hypothetical protein
MKRVLPVLIFILVINSGCTSMLISAGSNTSVEQIQTGPNEQTYQVFYDRLSPYGTWITDPQYGYVWMPHVEIGFEPYSTNGHWVYTNVGWTWVSNYNWGWATFHYGRWLYQNGRGWIWIPGHDWGPAWVVWGDVDDYYGWAPMGPGTVVGDGWIPPSGYWNFVPRQFIYNRDLDHFIMDRNMRSGFSPRVNINHNRRINPFENPSHNERDHDNGRAFINMGPRMEDVRQHVNTNIRPLRINENNAPVGSIANKRDLFIYKPPIMHEEAQKEVPNKPAPNMSVPSTRPAPVQNRPPALPPTRHEREDKRQQ